MCVRVLCVVGFVLWSWFWTIPKLIHMIHTVIFTRERTHTLTNIVIGKVNKNSFLYFVLFGSISIAHNCFWIKLDWAIRRRRRQYILRQKLLMFKFQLFAISWIYVCVFSYFYGGMLTMLRTCTHTWKSAIKPKKASLIITYEIRYRALGHII